MLSSESSPWKGELYINVTKEIANAENVKKQTMSTLLIVFIIQPYLFEFGNDLSIYQGIFVVLGIYSNNHVIGASDPEGPALETYLQNGGNLYLEGGDCFNYDPGAGGYNIRPWFDLNEGNDGGSDVSGITGLNDLSAFSFNYNGENNWMDELAPINSTPIWKNSQNNDISGVFNTGFGSGNAIGVVPSFGGLVNSSAPLNAGIRTAPNYIPGNTPPSGAKERPAQRFEAFAASQHQAFLKFDRNERNALVKKAAYYPELKAQREKERQAALLKITAGGVQILANNKTDLMAAYLGLFGYSGQPQVSVSPTSLDFDTVMVNQQASQTLYVFNTGTSMLEISDIVSTQVYFSADPVQFNVAAGDSQAVTVTFAPATIGLHSGVLKIATNVASQDTVQVNVSGYADQGVGINEQEILPREFAVSPNYPNPFNPSTTISYQLPQASEVTLEVYNMLGQKVRTLVSDRIAAGSHLAVWDGRNDNGAEVGSGIYFYRFHASAVGEITLQRTHKMIFLK